MKVVDYLLVTASTPLDLMEMVRQWIDNDWKPQGGLVVVDNGKWQNFS